MDNRQFYDSHAEWYEERHENFRTRYMRSVERNMINKFARGRILCVGCGTGTNMSAGATGIDISSGMLRIAKRKGAHVLAQGAAEDLPFRDGSFDTVLCMFTVLNLCDHRKAVREMRRVLKKGGIAIASASSVWDNTRYNIFRRMISQKRSRFVKMRIDGTRFKFFGFSKNDLIDAFDGFRLVQFNGAYTIVKPFWGWHRDSGFAESVFLSVAFALEKMLQPFSRAARMYFVVFEKR